LSGKSFISFSFFFFLLFFYFAGLDSQFSAVSLFLREASGVALRISDHSS
jgi:hypothetical protein